MKMSKRLRQARAEENYQHFLREADQREARLQDEAVARRAEIARARQERAEIDEGWIRFYFGYVA